MLDRFKSFLVAQAIVDFFLNYGSEEKIKLSVKYGAGEMSQDVISRFSERARSLMKVREREKLETRDLLYIRGTVPEPDPSQFQLESGIIVLVWNDIISGMLTPWGVWKFALCGIGQWGNHFRAIAERFGFRILGSFTPEGYAYSKGVVYEGYEVSRCPALVVEGTVVAPELTVSNAVFQKSANFLSLEDALEEWLNFVLRRRLDQIRPHRFWKTV